MDITPNLPKYRILWRNVLLLAYFIALYCLHTYKYQMPFIQKSIWVIGIGSLVCTSFIIGLVYVQTQNKGFTLFAGKVFGLLYALLGGLFFIEKAISETLLPDKLNSQVEMLVCYPFLLVFLLACYKMYARSQTQNLA